MVKKMTPEEMALEHRIAELEAERDEAVTEALAQKTFAEQAEAALAEIGDTNETLNHDLDGALKRLAERDANPVIKVRWDRKVGWTNATPVTLHAETDGYIDWPVKLTIARAKEGSEDE
jgi:hypothetical protein